MPWFPIFSCLSWSFFPHETDIPCWLRLDKPVWFDDFLLCLPFLSWNKFFRDTIPVFLKVCNQKPDVIKHSFSWDSSSTSNQIIHSLSQYKYLKVPPICQALCWIRYNALSLRTYCLAGKNGNGHYSIERFYLYKAVLSICKWIWGPRGFPGDASGKEIACQCGRG